MAKIWRNRIEAGTQRLDHCPQKYRNDVIRLIQEDLASGAYTISQLKALVEDGMMSPEEYEEITGEQYEA
jgi:hypothetical protein